MMDIRLLHALGAYFDCQRIELFFRARFRSQNSSWELGREQVIVRHDVVLQRVRLVMELYVAWLCYHISEGKCGVRW
jgi:hypothetical protein